MKLDASIAGNQELVVLVTLLNCGERRNGLVNLATETENKITFRGPTWSLLGPARGLARCCLLHRSALCESDDRGAGAPVGPG